MRCTVCADGHDDDDHRHIPDSPDLDGAGRGIGTAEDMTTSANAGREDRRSAGKCPPCNTKNPWATTLTARTDNRRLRIRPMLPYCIAASTPNRPTASATSCTISALMNTPPWRGANDGLLRRFAIQYLRRQCRQRPHDTRWYSPRTDHVAPRCDVVVTSVRKLIDHFPERRVSPRPMTELLASQNL